jgi:hypothetical protein
MKHPIFSLFLIAFTAGMPVQAQSIQSERAPNVFTVNGRRFELTEELLINFRKSWVSPFELRTVLKEADARWTLDFISIIEAAATRPPCKSLTMQSVLPLVDKEDVAEGRVIRAGRFDELWSITACGVAKRYRVLEEEGDTELLVYQVRNAAF